MMRDNRVLAQDGVRVSPRTVGKYMPSRDDSDRDASHSSQCWSTFVRNHAKAIIATDFLTSVDCAFETCCSRLLLADLLFCGSQRIRLRWPIQAAFGKVQTADPLDVRVF